MSKFEMYWLTNFSLIDSWARTKKTIKIFILKLYALIINRVSIRLAAGQYFCLAVILVTHQQRHYQR